MVKFLSMDIKSLITEFVLVISIILIQYFIPIPSVAQTTASCVNHSPFCSSGLIPVCPETDFIPKCLPAFFSDLLECCKNTGTAYDCKPELTALCVSSTSSGSLTINFSPFCDFGQVLCTSGTIPKCSNPLYTLTCLPGGAEDFPDCCRYKGTLLDCMSEYLSCLTDADSDAKFGTIDIEVTSNPFFPDAVIKPLVTDSLTGKVGYGFKGAVASFEIKLPESNPNKQIISVDLKDSMGFVFNSVPFTITEVKENPEKLVLTVSLPESISDGTVNYAVNYEDGSFNGGIIETLSPLAVKILQKKGFKTLSISEPTIKRIKLKRKKKTFTLNVKGRNFIGKNYFVEENGTLYFIRSVDGSPNTFVTIFPTKLNAEIVQRKVTKSRKRLKVKFKLPELVLEKTRAVLTVSTPSGSDSEILTLKPRSKTRKLFRNVDGIACSKEKPTCPNGVKAVCTNSSFKPTCLPQFGEKIPDCCRRIDRFRSKDFSFTIGDSSFDDNVGETYDCAPELLACPAN